MVNTPPPAAAFTALTASPHLCSIEVHLWDVDTPADWVLFEPGTVYPHLRAASLQILSLEQGDSVPRRTQDLQQLCHSCPALESLKCHLELCDGHPSALLPLLQLPALTGLCVTGVGAAAAAVPGVCSVAAQLTSLRRLELTHLPRMTDPALL
jgi:hypothetical protein